MAVKMSEFKGIEPGLLAKLAEAKITDTDELMKAWSDKTTREALVTKTGVSEEQYLGLAGMARLSRVKGMGLQHLNVLVAAGIDGPKRLFSYTPETLAKHLAETVAEKKLSDPLPTGEEIKEWFLAPKPVPVAAK